MATLAEIRAKLQAADDKKNGNFGGDNALFAHWGMAAGQKAKVRFLPDVDTNNPFFWVEKLQINLPFSGIKNQPGSKPLTIRVPCLEQWGEPCRILAEVRPWWKDKSLEEQARMYWKKKSFLMQGFVRDNPIEKDRENLPENPIRKFILGSQIFNIVKSSLMDPDMENIPTDYINGLDFIIAKTEKGQYADYNTSAWARKESALTDAELAAVEQYGLFNLKDSLGKKPDAATLDIMQEMFEASVDGDLYDLERWGAYFKPFGIDDAKSSSNKTSTTVPNTVKNAASDKTEETLVEDTSEETVAAESKPSSSTRADEILAKIRNRAKTA